MAFSHEYLSRIAQDIFEALGTPGEQAHTVTESLISANLMGLDSHGVIRIPQYAQDIRDGKIADDNVKEG